MATEATNPKPSMPMEPYCQQFTKILTNIPLSTREPSKKLSLQTKAVIELLHAQNVTSIIVASFNPFVCKLARVVVLASCGSAKF